MGIIYILVCLIFLMIMAGDLAGFLARLKRFEGRLLLVTHRRADLDAIASVYALVRYLSRVNKDVVLSIYSPEGVSEKTLRVVDERVVSRLPVVGEPGEDFDAIVFIDVGGEETLSDAKALLEAPSPKILVDHHVPRREFMERFDEAYVSERPSTIEALLWAIDGDAGLDRVFDGEDAKLFITAMLTETRFLALADGRTLEMLARLMRLVGGSARLGQFMRRLSTEPDYAEKVALFKGLMRMELYRINTSSIGVVTHSTAYQNVISSRLASMGADLIIVYGFKKECKIHIRISDRLHREHGLNLVSDVISELRRRHDYVTGGGHPTVATINISMKQGEACRKTIVGSILPEIMDILRARGLEIERLG